MLEFGSEKFLGNQNKYKSNKSIKKKMDFDGNIRNFSEKSFYKNDDSNLKNRLEEMLKKDSGDMLKDLMNLVRKKSWREKFRGDSENVPEIKRIVVNSLKILFRNVSRDIGSSNEMSNGFKETIGENQRSSELEEGTKFYLSELCDKLSKWSVLVNKYGREQKPTIEGVRIDMERKIP